MQDPEIKAFVDRWDALDRERQNPRDRPQYVRPSAVRRLLGITQILAPLTPQDSYAYCGYEWFYLAKVERTHIAITQWEMEHLWDLGLRIEASEDTDDFWFMIS